MSLTNESLNKILFHEYQDQNNEQKGYKVQLLDFNRGKKNEYNYGIISNGKHYDEVIIDNIQILKSKKQHKPVVEIVAIGWKDEYRIIKIISVINQNRKTQIGSPKPFHHQINEIDEITTNLNQLSLEEEQVKIKEMELQQFQQKNYHYIAEIIKNQYCTQLKGQIIYKSNLLEYNTIDGYYFIIQIADENSDNIFGFFQNYRQNCATMKNQYKMIPTDILVCFNNKSSIEEINRVESIEFFYEVWGKIQNQFCLHTQEIKLHAYEERKNIINILCLIGNIQIVYLKQLQQKMAKIQLIDTYGSITLKDWNNVINNYEIIEQQPVLLMYVKIMSFQGEIQLQLTQFSSIEMDLNQISKLEYFNELMNWQNINQLKIKELINQNQKNEQQIEIKSIYDLKKQKNGIYLVQGHIIKVNHYRQLLNFTCRECNKNIINTENSYYCNQCHQAIYNPIIKININIQIIDQTDYLWLNIFDMDSYNLLGLSLEQFRELDYQTQIDYIEQQFLYQEKLYKIQVSQRFSNNYYKVIGILEIEINEQITKYQQQLENK